MEKYELIEKIDELFYADNVDISALLDLLSSNSNHLNYVGSNKGELVFTLGESWNEYLLFLNEVGKTITVQKLTWEWDSSLPTEEQDEYIVIDAEVEVKEVPQELIDELILSI